MADDQPLRDIELRYGPVVAVVTRVLLAAAIIDQDTERIRHIIDRFRGRVGYLQEITLAEGLMSQELERVVVRVGGAIDQRDVIEAGVDAVALAGGRRIPGAIGSLEAGQSGSF